MVHRTFALSTTLALGLAACGGLEPSDEGAGYEGEVETTMRGVGTFTELTGFGSNPGALKGFKYVPENMPANAPMVLALHACSQTAATYRNAGWEAVADREKFYVLYPEQQSRNNGLNCFNWAGEYGNPTNLRRGEGENQSIIQMIDKMKADHSIDARRVFIMGHSGGGAQTALMIATWPEVFNAAGIIAGVPYNCTTTFTEVSTCLAPGLDRTPQEWGDRARAGHPGHMGARPRVQIWHGTSDGTVAIRNMTELTEQWTNAHGIDQTADATDMIDGATRRRYNDGAQTKVEVIEIPNMGHGTPVDPQAGCGSTAAFFLDANICAVERLAEFFGVSGAPMPGDTTPPTISFTAPMNNATIMGTTDVTLDARDDTAVTRVEIAVNGAVQQTLMSAPWRWTWSTSGLANGRYTLRATAQDAAGNRATAEVTVTVQGGVMDTTAPTVNITAPVNAATVSGVVTITASAMDDFGVAKVEILVDGTKIGEATAAPYEVAWDSAQATAGMHRISARAIDAAGNVGTDDDTSVTVEASMTPVTDTTPPTAQITFPTAGATVNGIITVKVDAMDETAVQSVLLFLGDELIGSDYRAPYEFLWDTAVFPEGMGTLTARAFDRAGNLGNSDVAVTITRAAVMEPEPSEELIPAGRKYWGCSTSGAEAAPSLLLVLALVLLSKRRGLAQSRQVAKSNSLGVFAPFRETLLISVGLAGGCGGEVLYVPAPQGTAGKFSTPNKILAHLEGKTLTMEGAAIPTHPNGFDEDTNYGQATQCYRKVVMKPVGGRVQVVSELGTVEGASMAGAKGTCNHEMLSAQLTFDSTAVLIENVRDNGACFDFTVTYPGFGQEGRGSLSEDGKTLVLEIFFKDQATGHRCDAGDVGDATVTLSQVMFTGDAKQTYAVE